MILGASSFTAGWAVGVKGHPVPKPWTENDLLALAEKWNLRCLQICDNIPLHTFPPQRLEQLKQNARNFRLEIGARGLTRERLNQYLDLAISLNAPLLRFVVDDEGYEPSPHEIQSVIEEAIPVLEKNRITLGIENHDRFSARTLATLMEKVGSHHVGICLDTANSLGAGEGLEYVANTLAPFTVNLHIKDFTIQRLPHNMGFHIAGAPAGKGMIDVPWLLDLLIPYKRCLSAVPEVWTEPASSLDETLAKEALGVDESMRFLTSLSVFKSYSNEHIL